MCCGKQCLKIINIIFVVLLLLVAAAQIAFGTFMLLHMYEVGKPETLGERYIFVPPLTLILFGITILPVTVAGCCGFFKEVSYFVNVYSTVLILLSALQVAMGILAIIYFTPENTDLILHIKDDFTYSFKNYKNSPSFVDRVQEVLHCCGPNSPSDWTNFTLPSSCCGLQDQSCTLKSESLYKDGCANNSVKFFLFWEPLFAYTSIGAGIVEILMAIMGYCISCGHFGNSFV